MPRIARKQSCSSLYHVINRGSGKQIIFEEDEDRAFFMSRLDAALAANSGSLLAWCLMDNHFHLLVEISLEGLSTVMHQLQTSYAGYFNRVRGRTGQLFGSRFKSEPVEDDEYLMVLVRYIHENPVKAGLPQGLRYPWSSYSEYIGKARHINPSLVLETFGGKEELCKFHESEHADDKCMDVGETKRPLLSDERALRVAEEVLGKGGVLGVRGMERGRRDEALVALRENGLGVRQIQRLTGVSLKVISQVTTAARG